MKLHFYFCPLSSHKIKFVIEFDDFLIADEVYGQQMHRNVYQWRIPLAIEPPRRDQVSLLRLSPFRDALQHANEFQSLQLAQQYETNIFANK